MFLQPNICKHEDMKSKWHFVHLVILVTKKFLRSYPLLHRDLGRRRRCRTPTVGATKRSLITHDWCKNHENNSWLGETFSQDVFFNGIGHQVYFSESYGTYIHTEIFFRLIWFYLVLVLDSRSVGSTAERLRRLNVSNNIKSCHYSCIINQKARTELDIILSGHHCKRLS